MQINEQEHLQDPQLVLSQPSAFTPCQSLQDSARVTDARLLKYLDTVCAAMPREVPRHCIEELRQEMSGHLQAAVIAGEELGQTRSEAAAAALAQFGEPRLVARQWRREWERTLLQQDGRFGRSSRIVSLIGMASMIVLPNIFMAWYYAKADFAHGIQIGCWSYLDCLPGAVHCLSLLFAGGLAGLRLRHRPVSSVFWTTLLTFPATVIGIESVRIVYNLEPNRYLVEETRDLIVSWTPCYVVLSCGAAYAGARLRQWRAKARRVLA